MLPMPRHQNGCDAWGTQGRCAKLYQNPSATALSLQFWAQGRSRNDCSHSAVKGLPSPGVSVTEWAHSVEWHPWGEEGGGREDGARVRSIPMRLNKQRERTPCSTGSHRSRIGLGVVHCRVTFTPIVHGTSDAKARSERRQGLRRRDEKRTLAALQNGVRSTLHQSSTYAERCSWRFANLGTKRAITLIQGLVMDTDWRQSSPLTRVWIGRAHDRDAGGTVNSMTLGRPRQVRWGFGGSSFAELYVDREGPRCV